MKTSELIGPALDWAVAKCENVSVGKVPQEPHGFLETAWHPVTKWEDAGEIYTPSTNWAQGGQIIERENIFTYHADLLGHGFGASKWKLPVEVKIGNEFICKTDYAPSRLIAAMRCYVASELGDEIEIPEELL